MPIAQEPTIDIDLPIARPPDAVWAALTDWAEAPKWIGGGVDRVDPPSDGTKVGNGISFYARGKERFCSIQACDPPNTLTLVSTQGGIMAQYTYTLSRTGDGNTVIALRVEVGAMGLWKLVRKMVAKAIAKADHDQLDRFKAYVEGRG